MKKLYRKVWLIGMVIIAALGISACSKTSDDKGAYDIYYTNSEGFSLVSVKYTAAHMEQNQLINELLNQMNVIPKSEDIVSAKPDYVKVQSANIDNGIAFVYYDQLYYDMRNITEVVYRSAVVKTLTQVEGIDYVLFYVNDMPAQYSDGTSIGMMTESDFIDDTDNNVNNLQWTDLTLYFANAKGDRLLRDTVSVAYSRNVSMERLVVEQLINGPEGSSYYSTLPSALRLLSVSVSNGTCYVRFDSTFTTDIVNVSNEIPIYSIVNSLCELSNIDNVQIMVNGDSKKVFRESISLEHSFSFNSEIVNQ